VRCGGTESGRDAREIGIIIDAADNEKKGESDENRLRM
jgi:hypothetical protein